MKTIIDYQILNFGTDHGQYFPGVSAIDSKFDNVILGVSSYTERESVKDAIEHLYEMDVNADIITDEIVNRFDTTPIEEVLTDLGEDHEMNFYTAIYYTTN